MTNLGPRKKRIFTHAPRLVSSAQTAEVTAWNRVGLVHDGCDIQSRAVAVLSPIPRRGSGERGDRRSGLTHSITPPAFTAPDVASSAAESFVTVGFSVK